MNALVVFFSVVVAAQAQLPLAYNGLANPGLAYNGLAHPGLAYNGLAYNGLAYNGLAYNGLAGALPYAAPVAAPAIPAELAAPSSQFQAQDELGNINYGYQNINSAKHEVGNTYGGVTGSYSYVDAYGVQQRVDYIADELGFRVQATNLPVAPAVPEVYALEAPIDTGVAPIDTGVAPLPVEDTEEVKAAKAEFQAAFDEATSREKRQAVLPASTLPLPLAYNTLGYNGLGLNAINTLGYNGLGLNAYNGLGYNTLGLNTLGYAGPIAAAPYAAPIAAAPYAAPAAVVASAPASREAVLTKIQLNPGHAVAYRVDK